jgi:N-dimethylarginine dimethylaminohydrolase
MNVATAPAPAAKRLNHVEFVHRPGERALVGKLFDLLGIHMWEMMDGRYVVGVIDTASFDESRNENYVAGREVRAEQWAFDRQLREALTREPLASSFAVHEQVLRDKPQDGMHFGIHFSTIAGWEEAVARLAEVEAAAPELKGRVRLLRAFRPGDPDHEFSLHQAFVWTDLISTGSLAFGQQIELAATTG